MLCLGSKTGEKFSRYLVQASYVAVLALISALCSRKKKRMHSSGIEFALLSLGIPIACAESPGIFFTLRAVSYFRGDLAVCSKLKFFRREVPL
jgi:hypothetical protein